MNKEKPILVTGSHRSGSTWIGKILSLPSHVKYVSEPFNPTIGLKKIQTWFLYINQDNQEEYIKEIEKLLKFRGNVPFNLPAVKYWLTVGNKRPLLKDPIACFSSDWLANNFNMEVVAILRHPAAFYASLKRVNWHFDFSNFLKQEKIMSDYLDKYRSLIEKENKSFVEEAGILWLCVYDVLDQFISKHPEWIIIRHEDVSLNPVEEFKKIYTQLDLDFTDKIKDKIIESSGGHNRVDAQTGKELDLNRDSQKLVKNWKKQLTQDEIDQIKEITRSVSDKYYSDQDW